MDFLTFSKVNIASILKQIRIANYVGKMNTKELLLFTIIGYLLYHEIFEDLKQQRYLESLLSNLQHKSNTICNNKTITNTFVGNLDEEIDLEIELNTAPTLTNINVSAITNYRLSSTIIYDHYNDLENDLISYIVFDSIPLYGNLYKRITTNKTFIEDIDIGDFNDGYFELINQGDQISFENINNIFYINQISSFIDNFNFHVIDDNNNPLESNMAQFTINITEPINQPPSIIGEFTLNVANATIYTFEKENFIYDTVPQYADPELDLPYKIKITSLPNVGILKYNNVVITENQEILWTDLDTNFLTYVANLDELSQGDVDSFTFSVSDEGSKIFTSGGNVNITIEEYINQPPTSGDYISEILEGNILTITTEMLTTMTQPPYSDPEGNPPLNLKIDSLPVVGLLKLNNINVTLGQIIPFTDIDNNLLTYVQASDAGGTNVTFDFSIEDTESGQFG